MKIVILAGGTGSIALQTGLAHILQRRAEEVEIKVIVNAYDNGLSTGAVRKVLGGEILGPSDVRKNQTTKFSLMYGTGPLVAFPSPLLAFLDHRFSAPSTDAQAYALGILGNAKLSREKDEILVGGIKAFFEHPLATKIDYSDFSVANIVYAGLAAKNGNSLRAAARIMAGILGIPDNVILNDDTSLFLGAITKSGIRITDEGDIVSWNNPDDPIIDVFFTNVAGEETKPVLCDEAKQAIHEADMIILSSGTQWSSLIPTYASEGFKGAISRTHARVLMVMNRVPDKDAPGQGADEIINTLVPKYLPPGIIHLIVDNTAHELMGTLRTETKAKLASLNGFDLADPSMTSMHPRHSPAPLASAVFKTYYRDFLDANAYVFDYDDTLVGRGGVYQNASEFNKMILKKLNDESTREFAICTGNSIKAVHLDKIAPLPKYNIPLVVYADGGVNKYSYDGDHRKTIDSDDETRPYKFIECLTPGALLPRNGAKSAQGIISSLRLAGIPTSKIENRGDVMLTIKPIDPEYREIVRNLALRVLTDTGLRVKSAGRTTIEIATPLVTKAPAVAQVLEKIGPEGTLVFVGDEFESGNDAAVADLAKTDKRVRCLKVKTPADTALFLMALSNFTYASF